MSDSESEIEPPDEVGESVVSSAIFVHIFVNGYRRYSVLQCSRSEIIDYGSGSWKEKIKNFWSGSGSLLKIVLRIQIRILVLKYSLSKKDI